MLGNLDNGRIKEQQDEVKVLHYVSTLTEDNMRMSSNQMAEWIHHDDDNSLTQDALIDEYFSCIIDCTDNICRKVCTEILK